MRFVSIFDRNHKKCLISGQEIMSLPHRPGERFDIRSNFYFYDVKVGSFTIHSPAANVRFKDERKEVWVDLTNIQTSQEAADNLVIIKCHMSPSTSP